VRQARVQQINAEVLAGALRRGEPQEKQPEEQVDRQILAPASRSIEEMERKSNHTSRSISGSVMSVKQ